MQGQMDGQRDDPKHASVACCWQKHNNNVIYIAQICKAAKKFLVCS